MEVLEAEKVMVHFYTSSWYTDGSYLLLCSKKRVPRDQLGAKPLSVPNGVTCPECLDILIPREEAKLNRMKEARKNAKPNV
jgi:hypothetical protein